MKNIKRFLLAMAISTSSMAALLQPALPVGEDGGCRVSAGFYTNAYFGEPAKGLTDLSGGLNFTHYTGYDFFYGIGASVGGSAMGSPLLFKEAGKDITGVRMDLEISFGFMPELAERLHFGVLGSVGYGRQFGEKVKELAAARKIGFGDMNFKAGLGLSYGFTETVHLYVSALYAMTQIRFAASDASDGQRTALSEVSNFSGMQFPLGFSFGLTDGAAMFVETTTKLNDFKNLKASHTQEFAIGVSFTM